MTGEVSIPTPPQYNLGAAPAADFRFAATGIAIGRGMTKKRKIYEEQQVVSLTVIALCPCTALLEAAPFFLGQQRTAAQAELEQQPMEEDEAQEPRPRHIPKRQKLNTVGLGKVQPWPCCGASMHGAPVLALVVQQDNDVAMSHPLG